MKLLLDDEEIEDLYFNPPTTEQVSHESGLRCVAQAQLNHIFNLDIKTTVELIDRLRKRLDKLLEREIEK